MEATKKEIGDVLTGMMSQFNADLFALSEAELETRWYYRYEPEASVAWNIYQFNKCLDLYSSSCRRWEEHHNGICCVVERVRDKYLMPKIKDFEQLLRCILAE